MSQENIFSDSQDIFQISNNFDDPMIDNEVINDQEIGLVDDTIKRKPTLFKNSSYFLVGVEIYNFKSYKGKHLIGPFTEFTAIIGPNGSGKSNLMDAISFALVVKFDQLRVKNISNLFDSSQSSISDSPSFIYVKLFFKSKQNPNQIITFQRSLENNKTTKFFIDDSIVFKTTYLNKLLKLGFHSKNHNYLIFQNTISKLILKDSKSFTAIVEELSGSSTLKEEYDEIKDKIKQKETELISFMDEKRNFFKSKRFVETLKNQTDNYDVIKAQMDEISLKKILLDLYYTQSQIDKCKDVLEKNSNSINEPTEQLKVLEDEKSVSVEQVSKIKKEKIKLEKEIRENEINILLKDKSKDQLYKEECSRIENRLKNANINKNKLLFEQKINQNLIQTLTQEIKKLETEINNYKLQIERKRNISIDEEKINEYKRLQSIFLSEIQDFNCEEIEVKICNLKQQKTKLEIQKNQLNNQLISEEDRKKLETVEKEIQMFKKNVGRLQEKKSKLSEQLDKNQKEIKDLKKELDSSEKNLASCYIQSKTHEKKLKQKQFYNYLKDNYSGVRGRLYELCQPKEKKHRKAISIVAKKYLNAIVVDSFKTVELIFQNEKSKLSGSEIFLSLDIIKAPKIENHLRYIKIVSDVRLVYDLMKFDDIYEKVIRFVVGNTLLCRNRDDAAKIAYNLGDRKNYNVISLDGTYFKRNGLISANLTQKSEIAWNDEDFREDVLKKKALQETYLKLLKNKNAILQQFNQIEAELFECNAKLEILTTIRNDLIKKNENSDKIQSELKTIESQLNAISLQMDEYSNSLKTQQDKLKEKENSIFGNFLSSVGISSIKEFELLFYDQINDEYLNELEIRLEEMQHKLQIECGKEFENDLKKWEAIIKKETKLLEKGRKNLDDYQKKLENKMELFNNLKQKLDICNEKYNQETLKYKKIQQEIVKCRKTLETINRTNIKCKTDLNILYRKRHDYFAQSFHEEISLPFIYGNQNSFQNVFSNIDKLTEEEIYEKEENFVLDFDLYPDIKLSDDKSYYEMKYNLEILFKNKEEEMQQIALGLSSSISSKKNELSRNIETINRNIATINDVLKNLKTKFETIKQKRTQLFNKFTDKVSTNLNMFYKELMQNNSAQSYLVPENSEEPYLGGLIYNCIVPGKIFQPVSCLSGGEKTLAILAFIFSVHCEIVPTFFIMDEIEACLDNDNIYKLLSFLQSKRKFTQFILISLKPELFGQTDSLIGVCKDKIQNGFWTSKAMSFDLRNFNN